MRVPSELCATSRSWCTRKCDSQGPRPEPQRVPILELVEPAGFEPATSSMPSRRAPNCATAPRNANDVIAFIAPCQRERQTTPLQWNLLHNAILERQSKTYAAMTRTITRRHMSKMLLTAGTGTLAV